MVPSANPRPSPFPSRILPFLLLAIAPVPSMLGQLQAHPPLCQPIYVRWPRVRLNSQANVRTVPLTLGSCRSACTEEQEQDQKRAPMQCSAFNHRTGIGSYANECQLFRREHAQHTDGYVEADDRYTFYWKYCVDTDKTCTGDYAFTFLSDRYMLAAEVVRTKFVRSLEDCLAECLNGDAGAMLCRSVSFNRTDGGCHLSEQNQLSKPSAIRVNSNPNFRIDYYENNCYNNSFTFTSICEPNGIRIRVTSRIPYTGALYGLYDFFSCRIEPKESKQFEFLFPYPHLARNCSDSMRQSGQEMLLEVVLSTDGVEPLYFITADDLTYQAKCPLPHRGIVKSPSSTSLSPPTKWTNHLQLVGDELGDVNLPAKEGASVHSILQALGAAEEPSLRRRFESSASRVPDKSGTSQEKNYATLVTGTPLFTKDMFTLMPLYTPSPAQKEDAPSSSSSTTTTTTATSSSTPTSNTPEGLPSLASSTNTLATTSSSTPSSSSSTPSPSTIIVLHKGGQLDLGKRERKVGMEPIFDGADGQKEDDNDEQYRSKAVTFLQPRTTESSTPISETVLSTESTASSSSSTMNERRKDSEEENGERVKTTTKRSVGASKTGPADDSKEFSFSTHLAFPPDGIWMSTGAKDSRERTQEGDNTTRSETATTPTTTATPTTSSPTPPPSPAHQSTSSPSEPTTTTVRNEIGGHPPGSPRRGGGQQQEKVIFDIFHNGQPAEAVVVGSRITLAFTPHFAIPPAYMSISGCQVEPIGSLYEWEKEPLAIIKDGCQADHVGLVCPPQKTDYGIRVTVEAFRYQTTTQVQYTCLVRVCPFTACPQTTCPTVEGCPGDDIVSRTLGLNRAKRDGVPELSLEQIRAALAANPSLQRQLAALTSQPPASPPSANANTLKQADAPLGGSGRMNTALQQQLIMLGGDTLVRRRLVVVNSDEELRYYVKTGEVPRAAGAK